MGTTFEVALPVSLEPPVDVATMARTAAELKGSETIMLVEDNRQVRDLASAMLARQGYNLLVAENGASALRILADNDGRVDLLLTDVVMPDMNGKALYAKAAEKHPEIRVLYMSGYTGNVIAHHGVLDQGIQFIGKPFTLDGLAGKVREVLEMG